MTHELIVDNIDVHIGPSQILFGESFTVDRGRTLALVGRNGAGKSTTMRAIAGLLRPKAGSISFRGRRIDRRPPYDIARSGVAYVPEDRQVFACHTVEDNLLIGAKAGPNGESRWTLETVLQVFPKLADLRKRRAGLLSGGEQQMLTIARALMGNPTLLLLDEPSEGLAPTIVDDIARLIQELKQTGATIVLAEQNIRFCFRIVDDATVIDRGTIVFSGSIDDLKAKDEIVMKYLSV